jgi:Protein of unknown function (DUF1203)
MADFRVVAIAEDLAQKVREKRTSPQYGHPAHTEVAKGYGPCRQCLRTFRNGEEGRILFTYNPFDGLDPYPSPGPVFIHEESCGSYASDGFPEELRSIPLVLEAYGDERWPLAQARIRDGAVEPAIETLLARPEVKYLHLRNLEAGCFIATIERVPNAPAT